MNVIKGVVGRSSRGLRCIKNYSYSAEKIFCIGRNKTGTTSVDAALRKLGYRVAPQEPAEWLTEAWSKRDFKALRRFCLRYDAFQDVPQLSIYLSRDGSKVSECEIYSDDSG